MQKEPFSGRIVVDSAALLSATGRSKGTISTLKSRLEGKAIVGIATREGSCPRDRSAPCVGIWISAFALTDTTAIVRANWASVDQCVGHSYEATFQVLAAKNSAIVRGKSEEDRGSCGPR